MVACTLAKYVASEAWLGCVVGWVLIATKSVCIDNWTEKKLLNYTKFNYL